MRTRTSPRNQERLWRALCGPLPTTPEARVEPRCFTCRNYPRHGRSRGHCTLHGEIVSGMTKRVCWIGKERP